MTDLRAYFMQLLSFFITETRVYERYVNFLKYQYLFFIEHVSSSLGCSPIMEMERKAQAYSLNLKRTPKMTEKWGL